MKIHVIVNRTGNLVGAGPVGTTEGKGVISAGIRPANTEDIMYKIEVQDDLFQSDVHYIRETILKLLNSKMNSREVERVY